MQKYLSLLTNHINKILIVVVFLSCFKFIWSLYSTRMPEIQIKKKKYDFQPIDNFMLLEKEAKGYKYYLDFIKPELFKCPGEKKKKVEQKDELVKAKKAKLKKVKPKPKVKFQIHGIIWTEEAGKSLVVLRDEVSNKVGYLLEGREFLGWIVEKIEHFKVKISNKTNKDDVKVLILNG